jgi:hypothetical protein
VYHASNPDLISRLVLAGVFGFTAAIAGTAGSIEDFQYEGRVVVTADGNGMIDTRFPTPVDGEDVKYYLDVHNATPAVRALNVTLNGEVVFQKAGFARERVEIALHLAGTTDNELRVSADGQRGSAADFAILAVRPAGDRGQTDRP